jgi:hypothetical protein
MNPNFGYQLYQIERTKSRAEIIADDQALSRRAAAITRAGSQMAAQLTRLARASYLGRRITSRRPTRVPASAS